MTENLAVETAFFLEEENQEQYQHHIEKFLKHVYYAQLLYKRYVINISPSDNVKFKTSFNDEDILKIEDYFKQIQHLEWESLHAPTIEKFAINKYFLEKLCFVVTEHGYLEFIYQSNYLLTSQQLQEKLNISRATLSRMVANGMETTNTKQHKKYPAHNAFFFKTSLWATKVLALKAQFDSKNLTKGLLIKELVQEIEDFEKEYGGKFEDVFANVLAEEVDIYDLEEPEDFKDWKDAIEELKELVD